MTPILWMLAMSLAASTADPAAFALAPEESRRFVEQGYLGPLTLCSPEAMAAMRPDVLQIIETENELTKDWHGGHNRHVDSRLIYDLCAHPAIVGRMASLYGPDLLLWRSNFFVKQPGAKEIPWHQDHNYWPLEPAVILSAWIAIDRATVANSCVQIIPGSHRHILPHVPAGEEMQFPTMADTQRFDPNERIFMELEPGQFFLFNERTLHRSEPNTSDQRRIGLAVRVIVPLVHVLDYDSPEHGLMVLSGRDSMGFNRLVEPPAA